jgi:hypothetical protein
MIRPISEFFSDPHKNLFKTAKLFPYGECDYKVEMYHKNELVNIELIVGKTIDFAEDVADDWVRSYE